MMNTPRQCGRVRTKGGFTLPEMVAVMMIVATLAAVAGPVVVSASTAFSIANKQRSALDRVDLGLERITTLFSTEPAAAGGAADIASASATRVLFNDGARIELLGTTLWYAQAGGASAPLCQNIEQFSIQYFADDGVTEVHATPARTRSVRLTIRSSGFELRTVVFLQQTRLGT